MPDSEKLRQIREARANRTGLFEGLGVLRHPLKAPIIDDYTERYNTKKTQAITPESIVRKTYGDNFDKYLEQAKQHYITHGYKIPAEYHENIPSYNTKVWSTPVQTHTIDSSVQYGQSVLRGATEHTNANLPKILSMPDALSHEMTHGVQILSKNPQHETNVTEMLEYPEDSIYSLMRDKKDFRPYSNDNNDPLEFGNLKLYQAGYRAAGVNPAETVAYVSDVNRQFYTKYGRRIETQEDLKQGLTLLENTTDAGNEFVQKGKADALRDKAFLLDLSKMLIKNEGKNIAKDIS